MLGWLRRERVVPPRRHWSEVGSDLARQVRGHPRKERVAIMAEQAQLLGLAPHTLQRYVVLSEFLAGLGVAGKDAGRISVAPLEVVYRIWGMDPARATPLLRALRERRLDYRHAISIERNVRSRILAPTAPVGPVASDDHRERIRDALSGRLADPGSMIEVDALVDARFSIVQVHRLYRAGIESVAFLDDALLAVGGVIPGNVHAFRTILLAASLFDHVVVREAGPGTAGWIADLRGLCRSGQMDNVVAIAAPDVDDAPGEA